MTGKRERAGEIENESERERERERAVAVLPWCFCDSQTNSCVRGARILWGRGTRAGGAKRCAAARRRERAGEREERRKERVNVFGRLHHTKDRTQRTLKYYTVYTGE